MRALILASALFISSFAGAQIPKGIWHAKNLIPDDGGFGKYYQGWYIVGEKYVDQITTLGMHYDKVKWEISSNSKGLLEIYDPSEKQYSRLSYQVQDDTLSLCTTSGVCKNYLKTSEKPPTDEPPQSYPRIRLTANWCVDQDCEQINYSDYESERLYNLNTGFKSAFWKYEVPERLTQRYGINFSLNAYSYRFDNDTSQLSSFRTNLMLVAEANSQIEVLNRSGVLTLQEGTLANLQGHQGSHKITVEFKSTLIK